MLSLAKAQFEAALAAVNREEVPAFQKSEMLVEIAMGLQSKPRRLEDFSVAVALYAEALHWARDEPPLTLARIRARQATALHLQPGAEADALLQAAELLRAALAVMHAEDAAVEAAEAELNLGLVLQELAAQGQARLADAISAYQGALRVFDAQNFPAEYALLHNNLATAYLAGGGGGETAKVREALAVQSYQSALQQLNLVDHPREYAMLQNNLGNALQYAASGHPLENNLRALEAYAEALKVRNERDSPIEYANTLANRANCLGNLPSGSIEADPLQQARKDWKTALRLFSKHGETAKAELVQQCLEQIDG